MKILFIDTSHPSLKKELEKNNFTCDEDLTSSKEEIVNKVSQYDGIILRSRFNIDRLFIDKLSLSLGGGKKGGASLFIARVGAGMEHIDVAYAESKGIKCLSSPEGNRNAVAEHTLGMLLSLLNNISKANNEVKAGQWLRESNRGTELEGKTIGIYGYGNTGSAFAKLLRGFDVKILAYDKYKAVLSPFEPVPIVAAGGGKGAVYPPLEVEFSKSRLGGRVGGCVYESSSEEIFSEADVLSLHLPLTDETNYLVNDSFINKFRKNIYLINTSRGQIVKTDDLVKNIKSGKILGACLDVLEYEETSFEGISSVVSRQSLVALDYLKSSPNVILTPHIAGWSFESQEKMAKILAEKIISLTAKSAAGSNPV